MIADHHAGTYDRARRDEAFLANHRSIEYDSVHADKRAIADGASVDDRAVSNSDVLANERRILEVCHMNDGAILYVRAALNANALDISTHHRVEPYAHVLLKHYIANDAAAIREKARIVDDRVLAIERVNGAALNFFVNAWGGCFWVQEDISV